MRKTILGFQSHMVLSFNRKVSKVAVYTVNITFVPLNWDIMGLRQGPFQTLNMPGNNRGLVDLIPFRGQDLNDTNMKTDNRNMSLLFTSGPFYLLFQGINWIMVSFSVDLLD